MSNRETEWKVKQLTLKADDGLLHERQLEAEAREYKALMVERKSEAYILETFVNKGAGARVPRRPAGGLRRKQSRGFFKTLVDNILFAAMSSFNFFATIIERCLAILMPAPAARELAILATAMATVLLTLAAAGEAPHIFSSMSHSIHTSAILSELRSLL